MGGTSGFRGSGFRAFRILWSRVNGFRISVLEGLACTSLMVEGWRTSSFSHPHLRLKQEPQ